MDRIKFSCVLTEEQKAVVLKSNKFLDWYEDAIENFEIKSIDIQSVDFFGSKIGFIKLKADVYDKQGRRIPGICFLRGEAVSILFIIKNKETGDLFSALVCQGRVPVAVSNLYESPAGMMDEERNLTGVAIKEVEEELHIDIDEDRLEFLTSVYTSPGGQDERISIYSYIHEMSSEEIEKLDGKETGEEGSNEVIKVKIVPFSDFLDYNKTACGQLAYLTYKSK